MLILLNTYNWSLHCIFNRNNLLFITNMSICWKTITMRKVCLFICVNCDLYRCRWALQRDPRDRVSNQEFFDQSMKCCSQGMNSSLVSNADRWHEQYNLKYKRYSCIDNFRSILRNTESIIVFSVKKRLSKNSKRNSMSQELPCTANQTV